MLNTLPDLHRSFAEQLKLKLQSDSRIHALLAGGSFIHGGFDQYSDLDFVVVVDPLYYDEIMAQRMAFAGTSAICYMLSPGNTSVSLAC
jgi:UTP:GlnB (protein PII) uridylyltransferase